MKEYLISPSRHPQGNEMGARELAIKLHGTEAHVRKVEKENFELRLKKIPVLRQRLKKAFLRNLIQVLRSRLKTIPALHRRLKKAFLRNLIRKMESCPQELR